jgi:hypothetical protein
MERPTRVITLCSRIQFAPTQPNVEMCPQSPVILHCFRYIEFGINNPVLFIISKYESLLFHNNPLFLDSAKWFSDERGRHNDRDIQGTVKRPHRCYLLWHWVVYCALIETIRTCVERRDFASICRDGHDCAGSIGDGSRSRAVVTRDLAHEELDSEKDGQSLQGRLQYWLFKSSAQSQ